MIWVDEETEVSGVLFRIEIQTASAFSVSGTGFVSARLASDE